MTSQHPPIANAMPQSDPVARPLHCLRGRAAPAEAVADVGRLRRMPRAARQQLYRVLGPSLVDQVPDMGAVADEFAREFDVSRSELAAVVRGCRFLIRQAAAVGLNLEQFAEDLRALGDEGEAAESLLAGYAEAMKVLAAEAALRAVADHGKVVERVSWRVDRVAMSDRGDANDHTVVLLTLGFVDGSRRDRITLQIGAERLAELRAMCDRLLGAAQR
ncbi:MAG TPA: hypothetical protein VIY73_21540 [Polyangiaceae bacterium]